MQITVLGPGKTDCRGGACKRLLTCVLLSIDYQSTPLTVHVSPTETTVAQLKMLLYNLKGISPSHQRLYHNQALLDSGYGRV